MLDTDSLAVASTFDTNCRAEREKNFLPRIRTNPTLLKKVQKEANLLFCNPEVDGDMMRTGALKLEFAASKAVFVGPKLYALVSTDSRTEKLSAKGNN